MSQKFLCILSFQRKYGVNESCLFHSAQKKKKDNSFVILFLYTYTPAWPSSFPDTKKGGLVRPLNSFILANKCFPVKATPSFRRLFSRLLNFLSCILYKFTSCQRAFHVLYYSQKRKRNESHVQLSIHSTEREVKMMLDIKNNQ